MRDIVVAACGLAIVALLAVIVYQNYQRFHKPLLTTKYQAVTLTNGEVFYGRIDHLGSDHPVLRDAFGIRSESDPQTQQPRYVLVRRKDSVTGADHLIIPAASIAFVEPVQADSAAGKLIEEQERAR
jgi:hypothetical protein